MDMLHWVLVGVAIPVIVVLVIRTRTRAKALDERIQEYKEEQEEAKSQPGVHDPFGDFAQLIAENRRPRKGRKN